MSDLIKFTPKGHIAKAFAALNPAELPDATKDIRSSFGMIRYRGKEWSYSRGGTTRLFDAPSIKFVILRVSPTLAKTFYEGGFDANKKAPPTCASLDSLRPSPGVPEPQSDSCQVCRRNRFYKGPNGRWTKDCQDSLRLAVLLWPDSAELVEAPVEPVFFNVPGGSFENWKAMIEPAKAMNLPYYSFITQVSFDRQQSYPKMIFEAVDSVGEAEADVVVEMMDHPNVKRITGEASDIKEVTAIPESVFAQLEGRKVEGDSAPAALSQPLIDEEDESPADPTLDTMIAGMLGKLKGNG